jgi:hypothetical protein
MKEIIKHYLFEIRHYILIGIIQIAFGFLFKKRGNIMADEVVEKKAFTLKIDGEFLVISLDPNKDGDELLNIKLHMSEVPDEVLSAFKK